MYFGTYRQSRKAQNSIKLFLGVSNNRTLTVQDLPPHIPNTVTERFSNHVYTTADNYVETTFKYC